MAEIKICGLARAEDVEAVIDSGVEYAGFVLAPSKRRLQVGHARELAAMLPASISSVLLFMNQDAEFIGEAVSRVSPDLLQFHGGESNEFCRQFGLPFVKAIGMAGSEDPAVITRQYPDALGLLYDSHATGRQGGTGSPFDWSRVPEQGSRTWLAGGLNPENVADAIVRVRPVAVDVSSGIEVSPGIKDHSRLKAFVLAARAASTSQGNSSL